MRMRIIVIVMKGPVMVKSTEKFKIEDGSIILLYVNGTKSMLSSAWCY